MRRLPVEWLGVPEDSESDAGEFEFSLASDWVSTDADQLICMIVVHHKTGVQVEEPYTALLKQYGGDGLLNDMLMSEQEVEEGSRWLLLRHEHLLTIEPAPSPT